MASPPPYQVEDQTDEDFFDKLVGDDVLGVTGAQSQAGKISKAFCNLSIGEVAESLEDSGSDFGFNAEAKDQQGTGNLPASEASEKIAGIGPVVETVSEIEPLASSMRKSGGSKVKEVQWSSFASDLHQLDSGGFGSYSDFLTENSGGSADFLKADSEVKSTFMENPVANSSMLMVSSEQREAQVHSSGNDRVADSNDLQCWENLYPGWKYDASTGQWYQLDGYNFSADTQVDSYNTASSSSMDGYNSVINTQADVYNTEAQNNGYNLVRNGQSDSSDVTNADVQNGFQDDTQAAHNGFVTDHNSEILYLQQTSKSVLGTIAEDSTTASITNWNYDSQGNIQYPPNMVFDPQYPEWYYDTNTQQWYTLESYLQSLQNTPGTVLDQLNHNASNGYLSNENSSLSSGFNQSESHEFGGNLHRSMSNYAAQNLWQPEVIDKSAPVFHGNQQTGNTYSMVVHKANYLEQKTSHATFEPAQNHGYGSTNGITGFQSFVPSESMYHFAQPKAEKTLQEHLSQSYYGNQSSVNHTLQPFQVSGASHSQLSNATNEGRSSAGRPPHPLVTFGFGGRLVVMKEATSFGTNLNYGSQDDISKHVISVLNLSEVLEEIDNSGVMASGGCSYFQALCQQSFPGPLVGGNSGTKDVNKWIDENVQHCQSPPVDQRKVELLKVLLLLLKISCQHYGKLRSPFGTDPSLEETEGPESDLTKLFASARRNSAHLGEYGSFTHCIQNLPSEGQMQATAVEVQNLLVSGRRKDALQRAQDGQLWGPALILAAQLGEQFYADTVKQMAHRQFISGSPLRTLCLLIAGQPGAVFSADNFTNTSVSVATNAFQPSTAALNISMLDDWKENLAIITANRTTGDELVITHLGDCLWKERGEVTAAHTCYLIAETKFESYSDSSRLCLIGADHWKCPRTYASPEAIQRTEIYEYSKVLGNSQFLLLPFQPYKLIYAYMLAEMGRISDSLRYCQASLKLLKNAGRGPEVETWKSSLSSLEERLRTHQQGGYGTNLAAANLVGKLFTSIDKSIHRMMGAPPAPLPPIPQTNVNGQDFYSVAPKVASSQSTMTMSSLIPSASVEAMNELTGESSRKSMHNRSISEPDFGRSPKQGPSKDSGSTDAESKASASRFARIGSQILQKTMGWVSRSRPDRQAKLGESNKFYYDEKLKRWVEEGTEPPAEEAALPPPPTTASFQNGMPEYNTSNAFKSQNFSINEVPETKSPGPSERSSGMPPIPPTTNQFSARSRMGVRSRYVDTFNKGGGSPISSFQSPTAASVKPVAGAKFFTPITPPSDEQQRVDDTTENMPEAMTSGEPSTSGVPEPSFGSASPPSMHRFSSMDNLNHGIKGPGSASQSSNGILSVSRAASWSGGYNDAFNPKMVEVKPAGLGMQSSFMPSNPSPGRLSSSGSFGDDLHEVEL